MERGGVPLQREAEARATFEEGRWLSGQLICADDDEREAVLRHLPLQEKLSRAEAGWLAFDVVQAEDRFVWQVGKVFVDEFAFVAHQGRVAGSE